MSGRSGDFYEFGCFRLEPAERLLLRGGTPLSVPPKAFAALVVLVERCGRVVGKEELMSAVWPETFVEENNLTQCIFTLRRLLDEKANGESVIETVPKLGYRFRGPVRTSPADGAGNGVTSFHHSHARIVIRQEEEEVEIDEPAKETPWPAQTAPNAVSTTATAAQATPRQAAPSVSWKRRAIYAAAGASALAVAVWSYLWLRPPGPPRIVDYVPISKTMEPQGPLFTDGVHLYFFGSVEGKAQVAEMSVLGGEPAFLSEFPPGMQFDDLAPDGAEALVNKVDAGTAENELWILPLPAGSPWPVGNLKAHSAGWSPGGNKIIYANGNSLYIARRDGSMARELVRLPFPAWSPRWSPDGKWIRFELRADPRGLWEVASDGTQLRRLVDGAGMYGNWTPDGRYFLFSRWQNGRSDLWALAKTSAFSSSRSVEAVRLTSGQVDFTLPLSSRDGKRIFAAGVLQRVEIVRYDSIARAFVSFLPGVSGDSLAFSPDGQWVAYSAYPERTLWRSRIDGSERLQLTFTPMEVVLPRWSPDGKTIAFAARLEGRPWKIRVIPAAGGLPEEIAGGEGNQANPAWSPDGSTLVFAGAPWETSFAANSTAVHFLDLRTRQVSTLPDSEGMWSPRWSPDGRYLVAETIDSKELKLYDFRERQWKSLARPSNAIVGYSAWSQDSRSVYFNTYGEASGIYRATVEGKRGAELVLDLKNAPHADTLGQWFTVAPDGSMLLLRDSSVRRIYALDVQSP